MLWKDYHDDDDTVLASLAHNFCRCDVGDTVQCFLNRDIYPAFFSS